MEELSSNIAETLGFLGTGFLMAWVFYGFTAFSRPSQFEQVIQTFIFTLIVQASLELEERLASNFQFLTELFTLSGNVQFLVPTLNSVVLGLIFAFFANTDYFHFLIRKIGLSRETSFPSEWYGVFSKKLNYVVLHLQDGRRLYGWPREWPSDPQSGHFSLEDVSWLDDEKEIKLESVESMLIRVEDVKRVEFIRNIEVSS